MLPDNLLYPRIRLNREDFSSASCKRNKRKYLKRRIRQHKQAVEQLSFATLIALIKIFPYFTNWLVKHESRLQHRAL